MNISVITKLILILTVSSVLVGTTAVYASNVNTNIGISSSVSVPGMIPAAHNKEYRVDRYNYEISKYEQNTNTLQAHGINTTSLVQILNNAVTMVINPLQAELNNATNATQVKTAYQNYCLFNGCAGFNYHLAARYAIQSLTLRLNNLASTSNSINQTILNDAYGNLTTASRTLYTTVGTSKYTDGTGNTVWGNIDNARLDFKTLAKETQNK
jgi:hypothetical protein